jgi:L-fuculose-phosphate aldolase
MSRESKARKTLVAYCRKFYDKGYVPGIDGNISMRLDETSFLITPSGVSKELVKPSEIVRISMTGEVLEKDKKPSIETNMHMAVYNNSDMNAVCHVHSPNAVAHALARVNIDTRYAPFAYYHLGIVGYVPYYPSGGEQLHREIVAFIKNKHKVILLETHGLMVMGADIQKAFAKTDLLETYAGMLMKAESLGGAVRLTDAQLNELHGG